MVTKKLACLLIWSHTDPSDLLTSTISSEEYCDFIDIIINDLIY